MHTDWTVGRAPQPLTEAQYLTLTWPLELTDGHMHARAQDRLYLFAALLQNVGMDEAVQFGALADWQAAIAAREGALAPGERSPERADVPQTRMPKPPRPLGWGPAGLKARFEPCRGPSQPGAGKTGGSMRAGNGGPVPEAILGPSSLRNYDQSTPKLGQCKGEPGNV